MFPNSAGSDSRPCVVSVSCSTGSTAIGCAPSRPIAACTFCARIAATTSPGVISKLVSRSTSSATRIEKSRGPNITASPTPGTRFSRSSRFSRA